MCAQSVLFGLRSTVRSQPQTSVQMSRILFQRSPGTPVRLHPSRTNRAIFPRRVPDHNRSSGPAGLAGILALATSSFRCHFPPPDLFWASDVGYLGMGHVCCSSVVGAPPLLSHSVTCLTLGNIHVHPSASTLATFISHFPRFNDLSISTSSSSRVLDSKDDLNCGLQGGILPTHPFGNFRASNLSKFRDPKPVFGSITLLKLPRFR